MKKPIFAPKNIFVLFLVILAFLAGRYVTKSPGEHSLTDHKHGSAGSDSESSFWTCSMHPQIQKPEPGKCPICAMDLVPVSNEGGDKENQLSMSESARKLARISTTPVVRKLMNKEIRMLGKLEYDETRVREIATRVAGRIDRLFVDYTGIQIKKGEHLIDLFSPDLYSAQEELIQVASKFEEQLESPSEIIRETAKATLEAARERLRQWGLTRGQIDNIEKTGIASDKLTIYSPISGVVIQKNAVEGNYVVTGTKIYTIADLTHLWVKFDAYESDIGWLRLGQKVQFEVEAYPGDSFEGRISFIDPILNPESRTVKVRVNVENKDMKLKPDMYVTGNVLVKVSPQGGIVDNYLAGKWIAPMHPEIVRKGPGKCPICEMDLVPAKSLGYVSSSKFSGVPLIIPSSAALITGKRAVVYVEVPETARPTYEGREVVLGHRVEDSYIVKSGLSEGELVVTRGAFKIDAEMQIRAKSSMMSSSAPKGGEIILSSQMENRLGKFLASYLKTQSALAGDNLETAQLGFEEMEGDLSQINLSGLTSTHRKKWDTWVTQIQDKIRKEKKGDINSIRQNFSDLSKSLIEVLKNPANELRGDWYVHHCPMAMEGSGADWLQKTRETENPYFGKSMLNCGEVTHVLKRGTEDKGNP